MGLLGEVGVLEFPELLLVEDALLDQVVLVVEGDVQGFQFSLQLREVILG